MPDAQHVLGVGSLTYFSETGNGAATEIDLSFLRVRDWPRLVSYDVDSDRKYHVGGADHRLLVAGWWRDPPRARGPGRGPGRG